MYFQRAFVGAGLVFLAVLLWVQSSRAEPPNLTENVFTLEGKELTREVVGKSFQGGKEIEGSIVELNITDEVFGAALDAKVILQNDASLARVVLIDKLGREHLVYEVYALLVDEFEIDVRGASVETKLLGSTTPARLRIELKDAVMKIDAVSFQTETRFDEEQTRALQNAIKKTQTSEIVALLNRQIEKKGMGWTAGETSLSKKTYAEKKKLFNKRGMLPNLQGYEYYKSGVFELKSSGPKKEYGQSNMVDEFDWRNRHGANDPGSPYYDGDELGTGWATSVKDQANCASCWAFAVNGTAEIATNLYYNRHIDLDLSEQYVMECSDAAYTPGDGCDGGDPKLALQYLVLSGVPEEECFPYEESNAPVCEDTCTDYEEMLQFTGSEVEIDPLTPDELKRLIIERGSVLGEVMSWWHDMNLVGFQTDTDGEMIMIFKNSWGLAEGENGFTYAKIALDDFLSIQAYVTPVISLNYTDADIRCLDMDKDGYCYWGIGPKAATCPEYCPDEADCDDSRSELGPMLEDGSCEGSGADGDTDSDSDSDSDTNVEDETDAGCGCNVTGKPSPQSSLLSIFTHLF